MWVLVIFYVTYGHMTTVMYHNRDTCEDAAKILMEKGPKNPLTCPSSFGVCLPVQ